MVEDNRKHLALPIISFVLIFIFLAFFGIIFPKIVISTTYVTLGDGIFQASLATKPHDRSKGLSGVDYLSKEDALLIVFPNESDWGIWMKDMNIPIDIVWLDKDKKVIYVVTDASPDNSNNIIYKPKTPAKYVIELSAGTVKEKSIKINSIASFNIDKNIEIN